MEIKTCGRPIDSLLEKVLCMNILSSDYFKELYELKTYHEVIDEIYNQVDHVEPWMTGNCRGPSTAFCLLYKFFTMKLTVKQMHGLLEHPDSPYIRAVGFLYLRYVADPKTLWNWYEPYVKDDEEFSPGSNGRMTTMGVYIRDLLLGQYYFDTLFPRIPVPVLRQVVSNLEKFKLPTTHCGTTGETTRHGSDDTARRPPSVKAALSVSFGQRAPHRASTRDSSPVRRTLPPPPSERNGNDDIRRSPNSRRSQSREYPDRDRDRDRERDRNCDRERDRARDHERERYQDRDSGRHHDRDRNRDGGRERDRERYRDRDRDRDQERDRIRKDRERERSMDYDKRSKYPQRESSWDHDGIGSRHRRSRSRSRSRSRNLQAGTGCLESRGSPPRDGNKTSASSNLAKLKDIYGDLGDNKGNADLERIPKRDNGGEEVIRLGGSTWKY
ncbi:hypothetical protein Lal_00030579 [Lupinus albus]|uniref:Pre-mRNA-splicing factor 38 n=1 Tax=Lupinus albus TaxID=3870 RepID=A0A6A5LM94_LUPAL|nr:putative pre-mRNA-splicing factor 38 [Lupinus albus]KAF1863534.1 hypothetical protein Lal_00030579 [Lupinus albus]